MYKVDIPLDTKIAAAIARRQTAADERKKRIFNVKERVYGKDYAALRQQITEKRAREYQERERDEAYRQERIRNDLVGYELEQRLRQDRLNVCKHVDEYRKECQRFEDRREFDLNDPDQLRKSYPARLHDEDVRCGPASLQRFEGEDLSYKERITAQTLQRKAWLDAQLQEKKMSQEAYNRAMELYNQHVRDQDFRAMQLWQAEREAQRAVTFANYQYNAFLACEQKEKQILEKQAEEDAKLAHIVNMVNSELLSETVDSTSVGGPHGVARDRFKGYTSERLAMIREEQNRQRLDKQRRELEEKEFELSWDKLKIREDYSKMIMDEEMKQKKRDILRQTEYANMQLARDQYLRQQYLNRILYKDTPTAEFYEQFNTTTR